jgi:hypothetical protein
MADIGMRQRRAGSAPYRSLLSAITAPPARDRTAKPLEMPAPIAAARPTNLAPLLAWTSSSRRRKAGLAEPWAALITAAGALLAQVESPEPTKCLEILGIERVRAAEPHTLALMPLQRIDDAAVNA